MLNVNILTGTPSRNRFLRQLNHSHLNNFQFFENSTLNLVWDIVIVYEELEKDVSVKYKKGGLVFISGEPPMSRVYSNNFLEQFDHLLTAHPKIKHKNNHLTQQALDWHYGFDFLTGKYNKDFEELKNAKPPIKIKNISIISSNKKMMPGHRKRFQFLEKLKNDFGDQIDFFGKGINPINDKAVAIDPYRFHICIENSAINNYWSEKFADPLLGFSVPIYYGCKNIDMYYCENSFINIDIKNYEECNKIIEKILKNPEDVYQQHFIKLVESRERLLNEYNIFNVIADTYIKYLKLENHEIKKIIYPSKNFKDYKFLMYRLRLKRLISKLIKY